MRVGFAGTPEFAATALAAIVAAGFTVPLVLTQPDKPRGRGLRFEPSAVKVFALAHDAAAAAAGDAQDGRGAPAGPGRPARRAGGRRLRPAAAPAGPRLAAPRVPEHPRVAAAALAGCRADPARAAGRRRADRRDDHADGRRPGHRADDRDGAGADRRARNRGDAARQAGGGGRDGHRRHADEAGGGPAAGRHAAAGRRLDLRREDRARRGRDRLARLGRDDRPPDSRLRPRAGRVHAPTPAAWSSCGARKRRTAVAAPRAPSWRPGPMAWSSRAGKGCCASPSCSPREGGAWPRPPSSPADGSHPGSGSTLPRRPPKRQTDRPFTARAGQPGADPALRRRNRCRKHRSWPPSPSVACSTARRCRSRWRRSPRARATPAAAARWSRSWPTARCGTGARWRR